MAKDTGVIIAAAGASRRFGARKQFLTLCGRSVLLHSLEVFAALDEVAEIVMVLPADSLDGAAAWVAAWQQEAAARVCPVRTVPGGARRQDSVGCGLEALDPELEFVLVHDAARPLIRTGDVENLLAAVRKHGAAVVGHPASDSLKEVEGGLVTAEIPRSHVWAVQTPQGARVSELRAAYGKAGDREFTDEAALLRHAGVDVHVIEGSRDNFKITQPGDERLAAAVLGVRKEGDGTMRVGLGYDNHRLTPGKPLYIGGVNIPAPVGADAHSDGDVLLHALCDALFGAVGEGDIGEHFPDDDPRWKGQASAHFLRVALEHVRDAGFQLVNLDATIFLEDVKLKQHKRRISEHLRRQVAPFWTLAEGAVSVKAKTNERSGPVGRGETVAAQVAVLLQAAK